METKGFRSKKSCNAVYCNNMVWKSEIRCMRETTAERPHQNIYPHDFFTCGFSKMGIRLFELLLYTHVRIFFAPLSGNFADCVVCLLLSLFSLRFFLLMSSDPFLANGLILKNPFVKISYKKGGGGAV